MIVTLAKTMTIRLKNHLLSNIHSYFLAFFLFVAFFSVIPIFEFSASFAFAAILVVLMFLGQLMLSYPFSITYPLYIFSCFSTTVMTMFFWFSRKVPNSDFDLILCFLSIALLIIILLSAHWFTRQRNIEPPKISTFSIFFFGLLLTFSISQSIDSGTYNMLFYLTLALFILISVFGMNISYRTRKLNLKLDISNKEKYLIQTKENLIKNFDYEGALEDIDLVMYYFTSSLESFIYGDFERSYRDVFKIIDKKGRAFKRIYIFSLTDEQWVHFNNIRNNLSHARITEKKNNLEKKEKKKQLQKLKELKKNLFHDNLELLGLVANGFC